jgi:hypothetical protein
VALVHYATTAAFKEPATEAATALASRSRP